MSMNRHRFWFRFRFLAVLCFAAVLGSAFPAGVSAQFPSQGGTQPGGGFPSQEGGFPSQAGRGGFYRNDTFLFELTWGPEWQQVDQSEIGIGLTNGVSYAWVEGYFTEPSLTPQDFVLTTAEHGFSVPLTFAEVTFDEPNRAAAYFDAAAEGFSFFIAATVTERTPSQNRLLLLIWQYPLDQYETEFAVFEQLLGGLSWESSV
jgi:hypothetical protein